MATAIRSPLGTVYQVTREELDQKLKELGIDTREEERSECSSR